MKTLFFKQTAIVLVLAVMAAGCKKSEVVDVSFLPQEGETDFFYNVDGNRDVLSIRKDKVIVKTKSEGEAKALSSQTVFLSAYNVGFWVFGTIDPSKTNLDKLMELSVVVDATYGLVSEDGVLHYPSDKIFLKCKEGESPENILIINNLDKDVEAIKLFDQFSEIFEISLNVRLSDILMSCRLLHESKKCEFAEPSFFREMKLK